MKKPVEIFVGDVRDGLRQIADGSVHCCVTSPPYWGLRDYGVDGQIGLEGTPDVYVASMVEVFREVRRCLRDDGVMFLNIGDSYYAGGWECRRVNAVGNGSMPPEQRKSGVEKNIEGVKVKDLCMIPWRVALALQADGWYLRSVIVWAKKSPMPESVTDRPTSSWEPIFLMSKNERYFYDAEAVKETSSNPTDVRGSRETNYTEHNGMGVSAINPATAKAYPTRNQRNVWTLGPEPYAEAHFATFPTEIPRRAIKAGTSEKGCCPECGAPWGRVVERTNEPDTTAKGSTFDSGKTGARDGGDRTQPGPRLKKAATGWRPSCECNAGDPVPCLVLDPFLGSGTTIAVARTLGRHGVGCELNPAYAELARERIGKAERPHTYRSDKVEAGGLFA